MEEHIAETIQKIHERNTRVETDKAWETSFVRIGSIMGITYICAVILMIIIGVSNPLLSALVPVLGYFLSTQSLPFIKQEWVKWYHSKKT